MKKLYYLWLIIPVLGLIAIRYFENSLFYDPFLLFFKGNYQSQNLPDFLLLKLFVSLVFRYLLNGFFSLLFIFILFKNRIFIEFTTKLLLLFFMVLIVVFYILLKSENPNFTWIFYIRRFLIQPIFLMVFVPALYYQKYVKS